MISTHVLDISRGIPAGGVRVTLERITSGAAREIARAFTNDDGRVSELLETGGKLERGDYRLTFDTGAYFSGSGVEGFYPSVSVMFRVSDATQHHHVPLLLSPYGFSTYRGS